MPDQRPDDHRDPGALSHDLPCGHCHHAAHHGVLCGPACECTEAY